LVENVDDLDVSLVFANAGCFSLGKLGIVPALYLEKMLDVNIYHFTMMHKVFLPWLIKKRAKFGHKSCMVGTSSVSEVLPLPGFGLVYTASKAMSSYVGRAINFEVKNSEFSNLIDTQVVFPGGTFTNIFNRPESSKFSRMKAMQSPFLQHTPVAVSAFLNSLKGGYAHTWGSFFCESFTRCTWFGIWGNLPSFETVHNIMG
jgi:short-subunit dehydrogenase